jgi:N-acylneuraminate cytidylyltransferase
MADGQPGELNMQVLAIIPARGGSKSIPRKNIRPLAGHPLIAYSIAAALEAHSVTRTIISTDDEEIAEVARRYGAETPFLRPAEFAQDNTTDLPVFEHALGWLMENEAYNPDIVVQLRPTSPIRPPDCVDSGRRY